MKHFAAFLSTSKYDINMLDPVNNFSLSIVIDITKKDVFSGKDIPIEVFKHESVIIKVDLTCETSKYRGY